MYVWYLYVADHRQRNNCYKLWSRKTFFYLNPTITSVIITLYACHYYHFATKIWLRPNVTL